MFPFCFQPVANESILYNYNYSNATSTRFRFRPLHRKRNRNRIRIASSQTFKKDLHQIQIKHSISISIPTNRRLRVIAKQATAQQASKQASAILLVTRTFKYTTTHGTTNTTDKKA